MPGLTDALATELAGDSRAWCAAQLLAIDTTANRASVSIDGSSAVWLPMIPNSYTGVTVVAVLRDPHAGALVLGPLGSQAAGTTPVPPQPAPSAGTPSTVQSTALIRPTWSGSWRGSKSRYDDWNVDRYGGRSTMYQGNAYGSGPMTGLAVYGDQVKSLGALSIDAMSVSCTIVTGAGVIQLQGSAMGTKPGSSTAPTTASTTTATRTGSGSIALPADIREAFRTGAMKGLVLDGTDYLAVRGTSLASGMALSITYTRAA